MKEPWKCDYCFDIGHPMTHGCLSVNLKKRIEELEKEINQLKIQLVRFNDYEKGLRDASKVRIQLEFENKMMRDALISISKNSCCEQCQGAKLVAVEALNLTERKGK